jgi:hypothetical protein
MCSTLFLKERTVRLGEMSSQRDYYAGEESVVKIWTTDPPFEIDTLSGIGTIVKVRTFLPTLNYIKSYFAHKFWFKFVIKCFQN